VAQYIAYDLGADGLEFHNPRYGQILLEAAQHSAEEGFKAETYFMHHPDYQISELATELAIDRHQLGKGFQLKERENGLLQHVLHLVLDFRYYYLGNREKELLAQLKTSKDNYMDTMKEYMRIKSLYDAVSKKLGRDIK
jgi:DNA primase